MRYLNGVYLAIVVFQLEFERANPFYGNARPYPVHLVLSVDKFEITVKLVFAVCHAVGCMSIYSHQV